MIENINKLVCCILLVSIPIIKSCINDVDDDLHVNEKKVTFNSYVNVVLIPCIEDYKRACFFDFFWNTDRSYDLSKNEVRLEILHIQNEYEEKGEPIKIETATKLWKDRLQNNQYPFLLKFKKNIKKVSSCPVSLFSLK